MSYFSYDRLPPGPVPGGVLPVVPEIVVEVRSPPNTWTELFTKVGDYLAAGVRVAIVLDMESRTAPVYRADTLQQIFRAEEELVVPEILPGFKVRVGRLFDA